MDQDLNARALDQPERGRGPVHMSLLPGRVTDCGPPPLLLSSTYATQATDSHSAWSTRLQPCPYYLPAWNYLEEIKAVIDKDEDPKPFLKPSLHPKQIMLIVWWTYAGLLRYRFWNGGEAINSEVLLSRFASYASKI
ncbi:SETMAR [Cordylochernes scorpioides]|uniref:SETMAR n=1 Tax=Cordylochernes scorpioides TaxID=51811 RepID=A0ABY6LMR7_9ARAC|nr:SETMAR [Cordylochernes scorpioides]